MKFLTKSDYLQIISSAIIPVHFKVEQYFRYQYDTYKEANPDFVENLGETISQIERQLKFHFKLSSTFPSDYRYDYHLFYFVDKRIVVLEYEYGIGESKLDNIIANAYRDYVPTTLKELKEAYNAFLIIINSFDKQQNEETSSDEKTIIKLNWKGQKNQLYYVIRQLKIDHEMLDESYDDLAKFIKQSFSFFSNTKVSTIAKELKKDTNLSENLSKKKRLNTKLNKD